MYPVYSLFNEKSTPNFPHKPHPPNGPLLSQVESERDCDGNVTKEIRVSFGAYPVTVLPPWALDMCPLGHDLAIVTDLEYVLIVLFSYSYGLIAAGTLV